MFCEQPPPSLCFAKNRHVKRDSPKKFHIFLSPYLTQRDEGITGLVASKRDDFNRMIRDCREGRIDRVLVKSISRFARNTKEYIQYVRELLRLGISIHFEKENIDTGKMTSEQIATIYGAFSQMESQNHSNNMRISVRTCGRGRQSQHRGHREQADGAAGSAVPPAPARRSRGSRLHPIR